MISKLNPVVELSTGCQYGLSFELTASLSFNKDLLITMNICTEPVSEGLGKQIINADNKSILEIDQEKIISLFKTYGVLLFRGFTTDTNIFREFSNLFSTDFINYAGGAFSRRVINGDNTLLSVNDYQFGIKLHGEMYYQKNMPLMLWFYCANPASEKGETTVCDGRQFFAQLSPDTRNVFAKNQLKFVVKMTKEEWQKKYKIEDFNEFKEICKNNYTNLKRYDNDSVRIEYICPAVTSSRCGNHQVFINSILPTMQLNPQVLRFEDDSEIPTDVMTELNEIAERLTTEIAWRKGDILMIDNTRIMHGRRDFTDEKRDIYIRLCSPAFAY